MSLTIDKSAWKRVAFGDVVRNVNDRVRDPGRAGIKRVIAMEHLDGGELKVQRWGSLEDGTTFTRRVTAGQTLFGKRRAYQRKVAYAEFDAVCSGDILTFEADESQLLPEFLPFLVQSNNFFDHALGTSAGSLSPRTNWRDLSVFEFDLPPLEEQKRIVDLLWALDRHKSAVALERCWLGALLGRLRATVIEGAPTSVKASEAFEILIGRQRSPKHASGEHLVPYMRSANVTKEGIDLKDVKSMNFTPKEQLKFALQPGDVLVSEGSASSSAVGIPAVWNTEISGTVCFQNTLLRYRAIEGVTLPGYVEQWCRWAFETGGFLRTASGTNIHHIGSGGAAAMDVALPALAEQEDFLNQAAILMHAVQEKQTESAMLDKLRSSILAEIFGDN